MAVVRCATLCTWRERSEIVIVKPANLEIRPASAGDLATAIRSLEAAGLPVDDLAQRSPEGFLTAAVGDTFVGFIGLEQFDKVGLLRSLIVEPEFRSAGLGRVLVAALESYAGSRGIAELWLLTIDADRWFMRLGYVVRERDEAPDAIRTTDEFSGLCPDDAVLMSKPL